MSAIDIGSHKDFFLSDEEDTCCPDWLHVGNQSGREEEYETRSSNEDEVEDFQVVEDFSPLELTQYMWRWRGLFNFATGALAEPRTESVEGNRASKGGVVFPKEEYTSIPTPSPRAGDFPHCVKLVGLVGLLPPFSNYTPRVKVIIRSRLLTSGRVYTPPVNTKHEDLLQNYYGICNYNNTYTSKLSLLDHMATQLHATLVL
jgi:hypothetical protein